MLKRTVFLTAAVVFLFAATAAHAFVLCDDRGTVYDLKASKGEYLHGTATNLACGQSKATVVGSYGSVPGGRSFTITIDQTLQPPTPSDPIGCCEGITYIGVWSAGTGAGNWYDAMDALGVSPCNESGTFTLGSCGAGPTVVVESDTSLPGTW